MGYFNIIARNILPHSSVPSWVLIAWFLCVRLPTRYVLFHRCVLASVFESLCPTVACLPDIFPVPFRYAFSLTLNSNLQEPAMNIVPEAWKGAMPSRKPGVRGYFFLSACAHEMSSCVWIFERNHVFCNRVSVRRHPALLENPWIGLSRREYFTRGFTFKVSHFSCHGHRVYVSMNQRFARESKFVVFLLSSCPVLKVPECVILVQRSTDFQAKPCTCCLACHCFVSSLLGRRVRLWLFFP